MDGRGTIVRKAMPSIPDLTDAKWQASRTDAELLHSVLEGKGQFMLPMKDKFALAQYRPERDGRLHAVVPVGETGRRGWSARSSFHVRRGCAPSWHLPRRFPLHLPAR